MTTVQGTPPSIIRAFAAKRGVDPDKLVKTLKDTAFKQPKEGPQITDEQMMALLLVADRYSLDPFTKEIYAFPAKGGGIVPMISIDGWMRIINSQKEFDGIQFEYDFSEGKPVSVTCTIHRKDRQHPTIVTEFLAECERKTDPWIKSPARMLRHKAAMQCARYAFGFSGIHDEDEARDIIEGSATRIEEKQAQARQIQVDKETGEVIEQEPVHQIEQTTSPAMAALLKKVNAAQTEDELHKLDQSPLVKKINQKEMDIYKNLVIERAADLHQVKKA